MATRDNLNDLDAMLYFRIPKRTADEFREKAKSMGKTPSKLGRELVLSFLNFESTKEKVDAA